MTLNRRVFVKGVAAAPFFAMLPPGWAASQESPRFDRGSVIDMARSLAAFEFVAPAPAVPPELLGLSFADHRRIGAKPEAWLFTDPPTGFAVEPLHSGFIYREPVELFAVANDSVVKLAFDPGRFTYPAVDGLPPAPETALEFAGFRGHTAFEPGGALEPFMIFAGASYFQAVGQGQAFGLSARGLAIGTGDREGEEFPYFRAFWLEQPADGRMVIHALLDSASITGAYRFTVRPGDQTLIDVEAILFARAEVSRLGLAPLTSMYLYGSTDRGAWDQVRLAVHNSDGLAIWNGKDERLWRPLQNPRLLQVSAFADTGPRGFGLIQREKRFSEYEDLDGRYHMRPSLWVEPIGDWGPGSVVLVEIPSDREINDNVVTFWRPEAPLAAGGEMTLTYRLTWGWDGPIPAGLLRVTRTLTGQGPRQGLRSFAIDYSDLGAATPPDADDVTADVRASTGAISNVVVRENPAVSGLRVTFDLETAGEDSDLRVDLFRDGRPAGEVWVYRWTA